MSHQLPDVGRLSSTLENSPPVVCVPRLRHLEVLAHVREVAGRAQHREIDARSLQLVDESLVGIDDVEVPQLWPVECRNVDELLDARLKGDLEQILVALVVDVTEGEAVLVGILVSVDVGMDVLVGGGVRVGAEVKVAAGTITAAVEFSAWLWAAGSIFSCWIVLADQPSPQPATNISHMAEIAMSLVK